MITHTIAAVLALATVWAKPPVFSDLEYQKARAQAEAAGKLFIVDTTADWCAPCKMMDRTTWIDEGVVGWLEEHAIIVQIDVDLKKQLASDLRIQAMPTVIVFKEGQAYDRIVGYRDGEGMLGWLEGISKGRTSLDALREKIAAEGEVNISQRYELAKELVLGGVIDEAIAEYLWLWNHMLEHDPSYVGVRGSFMAGEMERLSMKHPRARAAFTEIRDATEARLKQEPSWNDLRDWLTLNRVIADRKATLAWIDRNASDEEGLATLSRMASYIDEILLSTDRWAIYGKFRAEPLKTVRSSYADIEQMARLLPPGMDEDIREQVKLDGLLGFRIEAGNLHAGLLAADRELEAWSVLELAVELDDTPETRAAIARAVLRAGQTRPDHLKLLDEERDAKLFGQLEQSLKR